MAGFRGVFQFFQKIREFLGKPSVDTNQFVVRILVLVRFVRKGVMAFADIEPIHFRLTYGFCVLKSGDSRKIINERIDQHIDLQPTELGKAVILIS